jgi:hypothetical protein
VSDMVMVTRQHVCAYLKLTTIVLNEQENLKLEEWRQMNMFDMPLYFAEAHGVASVTFLVAGTKIFSVGDEISPALAGGFGESVFSRSALRVAVILMETSFDRVYRHLRRAVKRVVPLGAVDDNMKQDTYVDYARAVRYGQVIPVEPRLTHFGTRPIHKKIMTAMIEDTRPIIIYGEEEGYENMLQLNDVAVKVYPMDAIGQHGDDFLKFHPTNYAFVETLDKARLVSNMVYTPYETRPLGMEVGHKAVKLPATGNLGNKLDYQLTLQVSEIARTNSVAILMALRKLSPVGLCFPGDGNGIGATIAEMKKIPYRSGDIFPRDERVYHETALETIQKTDPSYLVVLSRVTQFMNDEEKEALKGREVLVIDRHHMHGWPRSVDGLFSATSQSLLPVEKIQDRKHVPAPADLPFFLLNYRPILRPELNDTLLSSLCRFIKLHGWKTQIDMKGMTYDQKQLVRSYDMQTTEGGGDLIGESPLHGIDILTGISAEMRWFIDGLPRTIGLLDVCVLRDQPKEGLVVPAGDVFFLRFKEVGKFVVTFSKPRGKKRGKFIHSSYSVEVVQGHSPDLNVMIVGSGKALSRDAYIKTQKTQVT